MSLTITDLFCGAGGSSLGAEKAGATLVLGLNHWHQAIETHATNFPHADHDCEDVSSLTTAQIRRYPDSDILLASPECTNHSLAKGALRRKPQAASLFDDGPAGDQEQDRSRATMWDVVRFTEQKILKGKPYKAIVVENVVDAFKWGANDDGQLFAAWRQALCALGYHSKIVYLNSMFCPPTPQSRDRMYVVFWQKGMKAPDLAITPPCWCPSCEELVNGQQVWKKPDQPWGRYGAQYLFSCPSCNGVALPGVFPAASAIDWELPAVRIGDRDKPLAQNTRDRIKRGLERLAGEPFAIRLLQGGVPKPLTLPFVTLTQRHDLAMVIPVAGNTFERTPGNRARHADVSPMDTVHGTLDRAVVMVQRNGRVLHPAEPSHTMRAGGFHHGVVMRNNNHKGDPGSMVTSDLEAIRSLTTHCHQSLVIPYQSEPHPADEACKTITTHDRVALLVPPMGGVDPRDADTMPAPTQTTTTRPGLATAELSDADIDDCRFRMFQLPEIARTMAMDEHPEGGEYVVTGNKRERMAQYGNAVTPPAMQTLVSRLADAIAA